MLSSLPKLADKNFVTGFIMPVLLGAIALLALLRDLPPFDGIYRAILSTDDFARLTIVVLALWAIAVGLLLLNLLLYRMLEGYIGPFNRRGWRNKMQGQYRKARQRLTLDRDILARPNVIVSPDFKREYDEAIAKFNQTWPLRRSMVLPTRFGNVIRAAESYPQAVYGIEGITGWLRLQGVASKDFLALVDDARAQVDFFVNTWLFACMFGLGALLRTGWRCWTNSPDWHWVWVHTWGYGVAAIGGCVAAYLAYEGAVDRASAWGDLVRSTFDLYLPDLARQLGYGLPKSAVQRNAFWRAVGSVFLYQIPMDPQVWPSATEGAAPRTAGGQPDDDDDDRGNADDGATFV